MGVRSKRTYAYNGGEGRSNKCHFGAYALNQLVYKVSTSMKYEQLKIIKKHQDRHLVKLSFRVSSWRQYSFNQYSQNDRLIFALTNSKQ